MGRPPIDDETRAAILTDIQDGVLSRNAIARKHGVSGSTVTKIAGEENRADVFDRSKTEKAVRAKVWDAKAARAQLLEDLYGDAQRFRKRAWSAYTQVAQGRDGPELVTTKLPPLRDQQAAYTSIGISVDKAMKLEEVDSDRGAATGKTMVGDLRNALGLAYDAMVAEEESEAAAAAEDEAAATEEQPAG